MKCSSSLLLGSFYTQFLVGIPLVHLRAPWCLLRPPRGNRHYRRGGEAARRRRRRRRKRLRRDRGKDSGCSSDRQRATLDWRSLRDKLRCIFMGTLMRNTLWGIGARPRPVCRRRQVLIARKNCLASLSQRGRFPVRGNGRQREEGALKDRILKP